MLPSTGAVRMRPNVRKIISAGVARHGAVNTVRIGAVLVTNSLPDLVKLTERKGRGRLRSASNDERSGGICHRTGGVSAPTTVRVLRKSVELKLKFMNVMRRDLLSDGHDS